MEYPQATPSNASPSTERDRLADMLLRAHSDPWVLALAQKHGKLPADPPDVAEVLDGYGTGEVPASSLLFSALWSEEHVRTLLSKGCDARVLDVRGGGLIGEAVGSHAATCETIRLLAAAGASLEHRCWVGDTHITPAERAANYLNAEKLSLLLELGVRADAVDDKGRTLLHHAADASMFEDDTAGTDFGEVLQVLLHAGLSVHARDAGNRTPLHYAARIPMPARLPKLVAAGSDPCARDNDGRIPADLATELGHAHNVRILLAAQSRAALAAAALD